MRPPPVVYSFLHTLVKYPENKTRFPKDGSVKKLIMTKDCQRASKELKNDSSEPMHGEKIPVWAKIQGIFPDDIESIKLLFS